MESNKNLKIKDIIFMFLPLLVMILIQFGVNLIDIIIIFISNAISDEKSANSISVELIMSRDFNQPMNIAYVTLARYIIYILVFGYWILKISSSEEKSKYIQAPALPVIPLLIIAGWAGQIFVDSVLSLARPHFPSAFTDYDKLTSSVTGASASYILLFAVFFVAPIAEEILFRGLIQKYIFTVFNKIMNKGVLLITVTFQALLFGAYHGNVIQALYAFVMGCLLGALAAKSKSLIPGMIFHIAINASILFIPESFFKTTASTVISGSVCLLVLAACTYLSIRKSTN